MDEAEMEEHRCWLKEKMNDFSLSIKIKEI